MLCTGRALCHGNPYLTWQYCLSKSGELFNLWRVFRNSVTITCIAIPGDPSREATVLHPHNLLLATCPYLPAGFAHCATSHIEIKHCCSSLSPFFHPVPRTGLPNVSSSRQHSETTTCVVVQVVISFYATGLHRHVLCGPP